MPKRKRKASTTEGRRTVRRRGPQRPQSSPPPATPAHHASPPSPTTLIPGIPAPLTIAQQTANTSLPPIAVVFYRVAHIQQNVLGRLNLVDAGNLASTSREMSNIMLGNKNLRAWVKAGCQELDRGSIGHADHRACANGPLSNVPMRPCPGNLIPPCSTAATHNTGYVCRDCYRATRAANQWRETQLVLYARTGVCFSCESREGHAHPQGFSSCTCAAAIDARYKCYNCREAANDQVRSSGARWLNTYRRATTDRFGRIFVNWNPNHRLLPLFEPACRCGVKHRNHGQTRVLLCFGCRGILVAAVLGFNPRRSNRIRAQPPRRYDLIEGDWPPRGGQRR